MRKKYDKSKFIKTLEEAPFVSYAAKKSGIARATIYRWKKENPEFRLAMEKALNSGRDQLGEIAEMALIEKIKSKDMTAIKFYLQHNNEKYRPVRTAYVPPNNMIESEKHCPVCEQVKALHGMPTKQVRELLINHIEELGININDKDDDVDWDTDPPAFKNPELNE